MTGVIFNFLLSELSEMRGDPESAIRFSFSS